MSLDRRYPSGLGWIQALVALVVIGCAGTESGNPIGPPPPEEVVALPTPTPGETPSVMFVPEMTEPLVVEPPAIVVSPMVVAPPQPTEPPSAVAAEPKPPAMAEPRMEPPFDPSPPSPMPVAVEPISPLPAAPAPQMCEPTECAAKAAAIAAALGAPDPSPSVAAGTCATQSSGINACVCGSGADVVRAFGYDPSAADACLVSDRLGEECLLTNEAVQACTLGAQECASVCQEIDAQTKVRDAQIYEAEVLSSDCGAGGECVFVIRIGDRCYLGQDLVSTECPSAE